MHESQTPGTVNCRINMGLLCTLCTPSSLEKAVLLLGPRPEREAVDAIVGQCQNVVSGCFPLRIIRYLSDHCNSHNAKCCREITARTWQVLAWGRLMWRGEDAAPTSLIYLCPMSWRLLGLVGLVELQQAAQRGPVHSNRLGALQSSSSLLNVGG